MNYTLNQTEAIESIAQSVAVIAGAGSGKTEILTERLVHILRSQTAKLAQILTITFTEKAAVELKRRIAFKLPENERTELPFANIGTIHSFCLNLLQEQAPLLGLSDRLRLWEENAARLHIHETCLQTILNALERPTPEVLRLVEELELRGAVALIEDLMQFRWHTERLLPIVKTDDPKEKELLAATRTLYLHAQQNYQADKKTRQALDFQDLEILTLDLLRTNPGVRKTVQERFTHILVDEAQDLNDLQSELIQQLFQPGKNLLCVVGDPKQSIYRFRGANVENFRKLLAMILEAGGKKIALDENFRSRPRLLHFVNETFAPLLPPDLYAPLQAMRENGEAPAIQILEASGEKKKREDSRKSEAEQIALHIRSQVDQGSAKFSDFAFLFASLNDIRHYEEALRRFAIPYRRSGGGGFLQAQEVIDLLFVLRVLAEPKDRLSLVGLMRSPLIGLPDTKITELCIAHPEGLCKALLKLPEAEWLNRLFDQQKDLRAYQILETAILQTHYDCLLEQLDPSGTKLANLEQLLEMVRQLELEEEQSLAEVADHFEELKKRRAPMGISSGVDRSQEACQILTVHSAKGLEFPVVILADIARKGRVNTSRHLFVKECGLGFSFKETPFGKSIPSAQMETLKSAEAEHELEEKKRLLYVAMTRAREAILIPWQEEVRAPGPWQAWIKGALAQSKEWTTVSEPTGSLAEPSGGQTDARNDISILKPFAIQSLPKGPRIFTVTELERLERGTPLPIPSARTESAHLKGALFGNLVHKVLKEFRGEEKSLRNWVAIKLFELNQIFTDAEIEETTRLLENFVADPHAPSRWDGLHEFPFRLKCGDALITGVIDYLYKTNDGWTICDFKSDLKMDPKKYQLQMDIYALALAKGTFGPPQSTNLYFLKPLQCHSEPCTKERHEKTEAKLTALLEKMDAESERTKNPGP